MTRINIIPPEELMDQHLVAEYRETLMVPGSLRRTIRSKNGLRLEKIPKEFTLNSGHVTFFYDKLGYLSDRYNSLIEEMISRGMNPDLSRTFPDDLPKKCYGNWQPTNKDMDIVRERISFRISQRPGWYRYRGKVVN